MYNAVLGIIIATTLEPFIRQPTIEENNMPQGIKEVTVRIVAALFVLSLAFLTTVCSNNPLEDESFGTLEIGSSTGLSVGGQSPPLSLLQMAAINSVTITSAKITIGRIRIKSVDNLDSLDFRSDVPLIVDLRLDTSVQSLGSIAIPAGTYDETRFRITKVDGADGLVYINNPDMRDLSIRIAGHLNGDVDSSFIWTTDLSEEQIHQFPPLTIGAGDTVRLVFEFDKSSWFFDGAGGLIDPRESLTSGNVKSAIENNLKAAFRVVQR